MGCTLLARRRVPLLEEHLRYCLVCCLTAAGPKVWGQKSVPSGALSAVRAWDRGGAATLRVLRGVFGRPAPRFVDDFRGAVAGPLADEEHDLLCRVFDELLGLPRRIVEPTPPTTEMVDLGGLVGLAGGDTFVLRLEEGENASPRWLAR